MLNTIEKRIEKRSTGRLSVKQIRPIIDMLDTSQVLFRYDMQRDRKGCELKFSAVQMMAIIFLMEIKKLTFAALREMTDGRGGQTILKNLGMPQGPDGSYIRPSDGWISDFRNHEYQYFRNDLDKEIRTMMLKDRTDGTAVFTIDSTPLEASRYSDWADYNVHYNIRMGKAHIVMMNGHPLFCSVTNGNRGDNPEFIELLEKMKEYGIKDAGFYSDGGYDSCESYIETYLCTGAVLNGNTGKNGIIHKEATLRNITRRYNKLHKMDGFCPSNTVSIDFMIRFLASHGEKEIAGWFLRNLDIQRRDKLHAEASLKRHICETVHHSMKRWVDLSVRGLMEKYAERRISLRITVCTFLSLLFEPYSG